VTSTIGKLLNRSPVTYAPRGNSIGRLLQRNPNDTAAQMGAMSSIGTLFSIVNRTSNATSQVNWRLYRKQVDGRRVTPMPGDLQRTEVTKHAAIDLWNTPNPYMDGNYFREACQQHLDLVGESTIVIARSPLSPMPLELWPVRPDRMTPIPHPTEFLRGWIYTGPDGEQVPLGVDDVLQIKMPNPLDPYRGLGPVQALLTDLDSARYSAEWNRNFFRNSAEPGGVVEFSDELDDEEFETFQKRWRDTHQGVGNAHRVAILEMGAKWVPTQFSPKDMQFAELRGVSREIIREGFGIHGHMLGLSQDVNKANAEAGEISFARWLVFPRAQRWKAMLNCRLLPMFQADTVEFDHDRVVPEDREADDRERNSKANAAAALASVKLWEPDDILQAVGLPPMSVQQVGVDLRNVVEMIQKVYLGVDVVVTADEAREILVEAGAKLSGSMPDKPAPAPPAIPA
jgi:HK97 family phage portal protein